ncbi:MAG: porin [Janthinobacterium lividum]
MKKSIVGISVVMGLGFLSVAHAQSSVTMYGIIDDGLTYANNVGGHSQYALVSGISQGSRWGIQGAEDLGGGMSALFKLENGFNVNTGTLLQGSREFGRAATMGLSSKQYGSLVLGRQNEMMGDYVGQYTANGNWGILDPHPGDLDNTGIDFRISNAVRYNSPTVWGLHGSALFSFGGVAGDFNRNTVKSFGLNYVNGPIGVVSAFTTIDHPLAAVPEGVWSATNPIDGNYGIAASKYQTFGTAVQYSFSKARIAIDYTNTKFLGLDQTLGAKISGHVTFDVIEAVASYMVRPDLQLGANYSFTDGHVSSSDKSPRYHTAGLIADYYLSKRTDVYVQGSYMRAAGDATVAALTPTVGASDSKSQLAIRLGIRTKF